MAAIVEVVQVSTADLASSGHCYFLLFGVTAESAKRRA